MRYELRGERREKERETDVTHKEGKIGQLGQR
jgi:hypothetical protein